MVETFIGKSKKGDRFRSDKTCRRSLSSIVHDDVFMFRKNKREIEVKEQNKLHYAVSDSGATETVGSLDAVEAIMAARSEVFGLSVAPPKV